MRFCGTGVSWALEGECSGSKSSSTSSKAVIPTTDLAVLIFALPIPLAFDGRGGGGYGVDAGGRGVREGVEWDAGMSADGGALRRRAGFDFGFLSSARGATSQRTSFAQSSSVYVSLRSGLGVILGDTWSGRE